VSKIIRAYEAEAAQGSAAAGRELRAWLAEYPPRTEDIDAASLDRKTRDRLIARLMRELADEDAANEAKA
jgi:hypothetical protein